MRYTLVPMTLALLGFTGQCVHAQEPIFGMSPAMYSNWSALMPMRERLEKNHQTLFGQSVEASLGSSRSGAAPRSAATLDRQGSTVNGVPTTFRN